MNIVTGFAALALPAMLLAGASARAQDAATVLAANRTASGSPPAVEARTVELDYAYSGQGLTGTARTVFDTRTGSFVDSGEVGPISQANGFDGSGAWMRDASGAATPEAGGDTRELAVNEAYRDANLWWRSDAGGARLVFDGRRNDGGVAYDLVTVTPRGGEPFQAWFDSTSHMLDRTIELQGFQTVTTFYSDYRPEAGAPRAHKIVVDNGDGPDQLQTQTLTAAHLLPARPAAAFGAPKTRLTDWSIAGGARETTVPFRLLNNHIYADVKVNGKGPYLFIFDTGGQDILQPATAKALAESVVGQAAGHGAGEGTVSVGFTKVDAFEIGGARLEHQTVAVLPFQSAKVEGFDAGGMIGFETFRRFVTRIDYGARTLTFIDPRRFDPRGAGTPVPFSFYQTIPQVRGAFEGVAGKYDIDTGSRVEVTLTAPFVRADNLLASHPKGALVVDGWGVGGRSRSYVTRGADLRLGSVRIGEVIAGLSSQSKGAFADPNYAGNVGAGVLKRFVVTLDYGHRIIYLKPLPRPVADTGVFDRSGMWINAADDGLEVVDVSAGGAAEAAGLKVGDHLLSIDGAPAGKTSLSDLRMRLRDRPAGTVVTFEAKRGDKTWSVPVTLRDQI
ncbi:MAG TPA: PDZ domain-containing protein [Caulobacteraceae bacterium]